MEVNEILIDMMILRSRNALATSHAHTAKDEAVVSCSGQQEKTLTEQNLKAIKQQIAYLKRNPASIDAL